MAQRRHVARFSSCARRLVAGHLGLKGTAVKVSFHLLKLT